MVMCEAEPAGFSAAPDFPLGMAPWSDVSSAGLNKRATSPVPVPDFNAQSASPRLLGMSDHGRLSLSTVIGAVSILIVVWTDLVVPPAKRHT
jgi:hypothetical protein